MIDLLGNENVGRVDNVFSNHFINFLYEDCQKQIKFNLNELNLSIFDDILVTNCIIDCHGLRICDGLPIKNDLKFPYSVKNWNIYCLKIQNIMFNYCNLLEIDKVALTPHSCWVERSTTSKNMLDVSSINLLDDTDDYLNTWLDVETIIHYRVIYFLKNKNPKKYGIKINKLFLPGDENTLYIVPTTDKDCYINFPRNTEDNFVLMFDWYLHPKDSPKTPAWKFPNKYNYKVFKTYIKDTMKESFLSDDHQKMLYKHFLKIFQTQIKHSCL